MSNVSLVNGHIDRPKMTDEQIRKALECCSYDDVKRCDDCSYYEKETKTYCVNELIKDAINLINRQKAEIERLHKEKLDSLNSQFAEMYATTLKIATKKAKSEAIKEFAGEFEFFVLHEDIEIPKPKCKDYESYINGANQFRYQIKNGIDTIVKEMTYNAESEKSECKPKQGKWLINPDGYYPYCSECGKEPEGRKMTKFCPECGADMRGLKPDVTLQ